MTFESFVVGPGNRVAWEAARTVSESPGAAYNPLFIYSETGLGKTHLLAAIANRTRELQPGVRVVYSSLEKILRDLEAGGEAEARYRDAEILLIDDLQFLKDRLGAQEALFHVLDHMLMGGRQVALACDEPPLEMAGLDDRLLSRFSGGLVVDIDPPNLQTRKAILERRLSDMGAELSRGVIDAIARVALENVRQLKGALHRVLALQRAEQREIGAEEVNRILGDLISDRDVSWWDEEGTPDASEFEEFLTDVSHVVEDAVRSPRWQEDLARAILTWESEGYRTARLEAFLDSDEPVDAARIIEEYERDIEVLRRIEVELERLDAKALRSAPVKDPDRLPELRSILEGVRREKSPIDTYFMDAEKVVWTWPVVEERLIETWDDGDQG
jgi:hypothetical protein